MKAFFGFLIVVILAAIAIFAVQQKAGKTADATAPVTEQVITAPAAQTATAADAKTTGTLQSPAADAKDTSKTATLAPDLTGGRCIAKSVQPIHGGAGVNAIVSGHLRCSAAFDQPANGVTAIASGRLRCPLKFPLTA